MMIWNIVGEIYTAVLIEREGDKDKERERL
jgi:hypothetical protein